METPIRIATIEEVIAKAANVTIENLRSHRRDQAYAEARQGVWYIAHDHMGFSFVAIARVYKRDHTTIMHGVGKMRKSKVGEKILQGIKTACPHVLENRMPGEARTVENWKF
jgi:chromosomal replication initiation ATPase DnaA